MSKINIQFDHTGNPELPVFVLANRNGEKIGGITPMSVILRDNVTDGCECRFSIMKYIDGIKTLYWDEIQNFKLIWIPGWDKWFEITIDIDESTETEKVINGISLGRAELSQIMLYTVEINTEDDIAREDYVDASVLYNEDNHDCSILHRIFEKAPHYHIAHVDSTIQSIQRTFSFDDISIYDACQEIAEEMSCIFIFDSDSDDIGGINRSVSVYDMRAYCLDCGHHSDFTNLCPECGSNNILEGYGMDTSIFVDAEELASEITIETDSDSVKNCFKIEGGDDLMNAAIRSVNPGGTDYIWYFSETQKAMMSESLRNTVNSYTELQSYYESEHKTTFDAGIIDSYNSVIRKYSKYNADLSEVAETAIGYSGLMLMYYDTIDFVLYLTSVFMPDIDIGTEATTAGEQAALLTSSTLSPIALSSTKYVSQTTVNSAVVSMAKTLIKSSVYKVEVETSELDDSELKWVGTLHLTNYSDDEDTATTGSITVIVNDDYETYVQERLEKQLSSADTDDMSISGLFRKDYDEFCEEIKLYCLNRLSSFYNACQSCIDILIEVDASNEDSDLYESLYVPYRQKLLALESEISLREDEIEIVETLQSAIEDATDEIHDALDMEAYFGEELWKEFSAFRRECKYTNDNYISDGLSNSELIKNAEELVEKARAELYKSAELQHSITTQLINLLAIDKFKPLVDYFEVGNYIRVLIDDVVYKLRLLEYEIDFDNFDNISVNFSDVLEIANEVSDIQSTLQKAASMTSSYESVKQQASQGASARSYLNGFIKKGLDLTTSKIVNAANNQTQTWDEHGMIFENYDAIMDRYSDEKLKIINNCIAITKDNFDTTEVAIGKIYYIDPVDGSVKCDYGISGKLLLGEIIIGEQLGIYNEQATLKFDAEGLTVTNGVNTVTINPNADSVFAVKKGDEDIISFDADGNANFTGKLNALTLSAGSKTSKDMQADGMVIDSTGSLYAGAGNQVIINADGTFNLGNGGIVYDGTTLTIGEGSITSDNLSEEIIESIDRANTNASEAKSTAENAAAIADGKNTVYYSASEPSEDLKEGDVWFSDDGGIYYYDGSAWVAHKVGTVSIADGAVTADKIVTSTALVEKLLAKDVTASGQITATNMYITGDSVFDGTLNVNNLAAASGNLGAFAITQELDDSSPVGNFNVTNGSYRFESNGRISLISASSDKECVLTFLVEISSISGYGTNEYPEIDIDIGCSSLINTYVSSAGDEVTIPDDPTATCIIREQRGGILFEGSIFDDVLNGSHSEAFFTDGEYLRVEVTLSAASVMKGFQISFTSINGSISTLDYLSYYNSSALAINAAAIDERLDESKKAIYLGTNGIISFDEEGHWSSVRGGTIETEELYGSKGIYGRGGTPLFYKNGDIISSYCIAAGFLTNSQTGLNFLLPTPPVCGDTVKMNSLSLLLRHADGGYPYARSGSSGGTYTQLGSSQVEVWSNGASVRTNEISSITCTPVIGGIRVIVNFTYALTKDSGSTTAVTNNVPMAVVCTYDVAIT